MDVSDLHCVRCNSCAVQGKVRTLNFANLEWSEHNVHVLAFLSGQSCLSNFVLHFLGVQEMAII